MVRWFSSTVTAERARADCTRGLLTAVWCSRGSCRGSPRASMMLATSGWLAFSLRRNTTAMSPLSRRTKVPGGHSPTARTSV